MVKFERMDIAAESVSSLCWQGDLVIDIIGLQRKFNLDGMIYEPDIGRCYGYRFDNVISHGKYAVIHETYGTKALLFDIEKERVMRELNRSYYEADAYRYPVALITLPDGRDVIAHCPHDYQNLDIEVCETGEILTGREYGGPDIFHSDLQASPDGRYLLDRGWVWHPWNILAVYDLEESLKDPRLLDGKGLYDQNPLLNCWESMSATFCGHKVVHSLVLEGDPNKVESIDIQPAEKGVPETATDAEGVSTDGRKKVRRVMKTELSIADKNGNPIDMGDTRKNPYRFRHLLEVFDLDTGKTSSIREMPEFVGRMMPVGESHVISFYDHPKLLEIATGKIIHRWEDIDPGPEIEQPSTMTSPLKAPYLTCDPSKRRFAVGTNKGVTIVTIGQF
jgi:hypothetical protein